MSVRPTRKLPSERLLFFGALLVVGLIVVPVYQLFGSPETFRDFQEKWNSERLARLVLGPEQAACFFCAAWAGLILLSRRLEVSRQRRAFLMELLPTFEGARILPEDARPLSRKIDTVVRDGPSILANMIRLGLGKYAISRSAPDVAEVVRNQGEVELSRFVVSMGTVNYLAWAIPAIGFLGTVRGLAGGMSMASSKEADVAKFVKQATDQLGIAFDCTFVALALSLLLMYLLHNVQKSEEMLVIDCQDYCQEHLLMRLVDPKPEPLMLEAS